MMSMLTALNQKFDESEEETGHGGGMMPVAETVPGVGTMDHCGNGCGNGDCSHEEEENTLELQ